MIKEEMQEIFTNWWEALQNDSGGRARLRRCHSPEDVALQSETHRLKMMLPKWVPYELVATFAGLASHIKNNTGPGFAESLATPKGSGGKIPLSETRFRQLLSSRDWNELYKNLRRAIEILEGSVNLNSFINIVFLWNDEFRDSYKRPGKGLKFELSRSYYETAIKYE